MSFGFFSNFFFEGKGVMDDGIMTCLSGCSLQVVALGAASGSGNVMSVSLAQLRAEPGSLRQ